MHIAVEYANELRTCVSALFKACAVIFLIQNGNASVVSCSNEDATKRDCSKEETLHSIDRKAQMEFLNKGQLVFGVLLTAEAGEGVKALASVNVKETATWLLKNISANPEVTQIFGVGISIRLLYDSFSDREAVNRLKEEYEDLYRTRVDAFVNQKEYIEHLFKRSI